LSCLELIGAIRPVLCHHSLHDALDRFRATALKKTQSDAVNVAHDTGCAPPESQTTPAYSRNLVVLVEEAVLGEEVGHLRETGMAEETDLCRSLQSGVCQRLRDEQELWRAGIQFLPEDRRIRVLAVVRKSARLRAQLDYTPSHCETVVATVMTNY
ncbi:hypothetical protein PENTCL1PPCAC_274, partial [Pristionchus entomophagus]